MAISVVFEFPHESVDNYYKVFELGGQPILDQPARLHHQCFKNGDGWTVIDVWDTEEAFAQFGEVLGPVLQEVGLSTAPNVHPTCRTINQRGELVDY